jgi:hypothetical protein
MWVDFQVSGQKMMCLERNEIEAARWDAAPRISGSLMSFLLYVKLRWKAGGR